MLTFLGPIFFLGQIELNTYFALMADRSEYGPIQLPSPPYSVPSLP
jgi:hypothetical protein